MRRAPAPAGLARGVLHRALDALDVVHDRRLPSPDLAPFIAHLWTVRWDLDAPLRVETLGHPAVHLTITTDDDGDGVSAVIAGPHTARFERFLVGRGHVVGVKFRPAMFSAWWPQPVSSLADTTKPLTELPGVDVAALVAVAVADCPFLEQIDGLEAVLRAALPRLVADDVVIRDLVEQLATDQSLLRVQDLTALVGGSVRTLQRRFNDVVGVSPKWVIKRYRLHEAAARLRAPSSPSLVELAISLGYADQAHFTRDFTATIGVSPMRWAEG